MSEPPEKEAPAKAGTKAGRVNRTVEERKMPDGGPNVNPAEKPAWKPRARNIKLAGTNGGWFWEESSIQDLLLTRCVAVDYPSALAVYSALARLSSDRRDAAEITVGMALIAKLSGVSKRTVVSALAELESLKIIHVSRSKSGKQNGENCYTLLASRGSTANRTPPSAINAVVKENGPFPFTTLKEIEEKGGASAPAPSGAGAPRAGTGSPLGDDRNESSEKPHDPTYGGLKPKVVE